MKCEHCHERSATLHFTQYTHGYKHGQHLCHTCASDLGLIEANDHYLIHDLLSDLVKMNSALANNQRRSSAQEIKICPTCHMTYTQFVKHYKFGCKDCYETFTSELEPVLKRVHNGNTAHVGKVPKHRHPHISKQQQIKTYRDQLKSCIESEQFEEAAELRDMIKALEQGESIAEEDE
ncbi:protein arginine kinase activator [Halolactibacillus halophilus]|uniref:Excinuclease Uvr n=1 Tax=Halolactibacillus halophilus TaxID=306540 RepID=A0A1I5SSK8_9BACI|nr:UvrB/UvrC motif-containing protein [Halolactibacillus halophilus]GEM02689.1 excinuclease Uvr [Halolactibacillus halophilus]SFP73794.1 protein arginine kinase activator [Halolactibacillus halophilus]